MGVKMKAVSLQYDITSTFSSTYSLPRD